ncbi:MAG TPA: hypothetical protein VM429_04250 [Micropruina sp.]|nr:hypothetical protein [Micropruina sp.]
MDLALVFAPGHLYIRNNPNGDFRDLTAKTVNQASGRAFKRGIRDLTDPAPETTRRLGVDRSVRPGRPGRPVVEVADDLTDPVATLRRVRPKRYRWHDDPVDRPERAGFIAEEMPTPIRVTDVHPATDPDEAPLVIESIDYSALTTVVVAAVQRIEERVSELESRTRPGPPA